MKARSFSDPQAAATDPVGIVGKIRKRNRFLNLEFELDFPESPPVSISVNWAGQATGKIRGNKVALFALSHLEDLNRDKPMVAYSHEGLRLDRRLPVELMGLSLDLRRVGARLVLEHEAELVWTWRKAWKDSEAADQTEALLFVPEPERWGPNLDWFLFLALNVHVAEWMTTSGSRSSN